MYGAHKIILHTIKRATQGQCFIDAHCPAAVTAGVPGAAIDGLGLYSYGPGPAVKLPPIASRWQDLWRQTARFHSGCETSASAALSCLSRTASLLLFLVATLTTTTL